MFHFKLPCHLIKAIIIIALIFIGCDSREDLRAFEGTWIFSENSVLYKGEVISDCLLLNVITLDRLSIHFPGVVCRDNRELALSNSTFEILDYSLKNEMFIDLSCENSIFSGRYSLLFDIDSENELAYMEMKSENVQFLCYRDGVYESPELIQELFDQIRKMDPDSPSIIK